MRGPSSSNGIKQFVSGFREALTKRHEAAMAQQQDAYAALITLRDHYRYRLGGLDCGGR